MTPVRCLPLPKQSNLEQQEEETPTMNIHLVITRAILVASLAVIPWIAAPSGQAADKPSKTPAKASAKAAKASAPPTQSEGRSTVASGAVEDTQSDCLTRIPKDATAGQRMLAEDSCKRDQKSR